MGSIVKSIGKAIKGIGKALKKIAPILLIAAAVYLGYGFMTGFQSGGWPQIMNWGKSLMGGVSQGQTISSAATAATETVGAVGAETAALGGADISSAVATALPAQEAVTATAIPTSDVASTVAQPLTGMIGQSGDVGATVAEAGGLTDGMGLPTSNWATEAMTQGGQSLTSLGSEIGTGWKDITSGVLDSLNPMSSAYGAPITTAGSRFPLLNSAALNEAAAEQVVVDGMGFPGGTPTHPGIPVPEKVIAPNAATAQSLTSAADLGAKAHTDPSEQVTFWNKLSQLGKKGWETYKKMWADNPGMAMWTTNNVLRTIMAMLDDSAEKESYRRRHVAGFAPGGWDEVAERYGGNLPGGKGGGAGYSTAGSRRPSSGIKTGPTPEVARSRTSAIDRKPGGIIGSNPQRMLS